MSTKLLLPNKFKFIGWCLLIPFSIIGLILTLTNTDTLELHSKIFAVFAQGVMEDVEFFKVYEANITPTIVGALFIAGALMVGFSKEKSEDEYIAKIRLSSLVWAVCLNYSLLFVCFLFVYGLAFLTVMIYNMFTVLILFIVRFHYILYKNSKAPSDEK